MVSAISAAIGMTLISVIRDPQERGCRGSYPTLARYLRRLQAIDTAVTASRLPASARPMLDAALRHVLTPRTAAWTVLRRAKRRTVESPALPADVRDHSPTPNHAIEPAEAFIARVRGRGAAQLDD